MRLKFLSENCIGCKLCQLACSSAKDGVFNPSLARLSVTSYYSKGQLCIDGRVCTLCGECVVACPADAITVKNGALQFASDLCTSCNICVEACPEKVIVQCREGVAICDLCDGKPNCVHWCPHAALVLEEVS